MLSAYETSPWTEPLLPFECYLDKIKPLEKGAVEHRLRTHSIKSQVSICERMGIKCGVHPMNCKNCAEAHGMERGGRN